MPQKSLQVILYTIFLLAAVFFAFRNLFNLESSVVWGDAPYFYPQALGELWGQAYSWTNRGEPLGGVNRAIWIAPLMVIFGGLHNFFGLDSTLIVKLLFYWPAILLSLVSSYIFAKHLSLSPLARLIAASLYTLNTYFILLIDGGQVGIALAFGIFPLAVASLVNFLRNPNFTNFCLSTAVYIFLTIADARFVSISLLVVLAWQTAFFLLTKKFNKAFYVRYLLFSLSVGLVGLYWILPTFLLTPGSLSDLKPQSVRLINPLLLFQPHWPDNVLGRAEGPSFYFALFPVLVGLGLFLNRSIVVATLAIVLALFVFLAKGNTSPLGQVYDILVTLPYGIAFRDSTKFFGPVLLFSSVLIGFTYDYLASKFATYRYFPFFLSLCFLGYFTLTIFPAIEGQMNGVLKPRSVGDEYKSIASLVARETVSFRSLWFPERHPFGFESSRHPAVDAKLLVTKRPFASINIGTDPYNFLNNRLMPDFLGILGIKYLILSGDFRNLHPNEEDKKNWDEIVRLVQSNPKFKVERISTVPILENTRVRPRIFATDKLVAVVGSDDIYKILESEGLSTVFNQAFLFFEDGKFNPRDLISSSNVVVVLNKKDEMDLTMAFLQDFYLNGNPEILEWAIRKSGDYLKYKYEFLTKGLSTQEFDYGKNVYFSTKRGERIVYPIKVDSRGEYILAIRSMGLDSDLEIVLDSYVKSIKTTDNYSWQISRFSLDPGEHEIKIINEGKLAVVNAISLVPIDIWNKAQSEKNILLKKFPVFQLGNQQDLTNLLDTLAGSQWTPLEYQQENNTRYNLNVPPSSWIVFSESYHPEWILENTHGFSKPLPGYSMLNIFYPEKGGNMSLIFEGQKYLRLGKYFSVLFIVIFLVLFLVRKNIVKRRI